jgi:elongation factor 1 alpha-like protein
MARWVDTLAVARLPGPAAGAWGALQSCLCLSSAAGACCAHCPPQNPDSQRGISASKTETPLAVAPQAVQFAQAGDGADVFLSGIDAANLSSGAVLCHPGFPVPLVTKFEARVVVLEVTVPILRGQMVVVHAHTAREAGNVSALVALLDAKTGDVAKARPRCLLKGQTAMVEVTLARSMCLEEFKDYKALGRVALRDGGRTIAVGIVTQVLE